MLILTRKEGEVIRIGDSVTVLIIEICGRQVRIGIEAPRSISVHREEIYALIQRQAATASQPAPQTEDSPPPAASPQ